MTSPQQRSQVMTVIEGDQEPDYDTMTIGVGALREGDQFRRHSWPSFNVVVSGGQPYEDIASPVVEAVVRPRTPKFERGDRVAWSWSGGDRFGWVIESREEVEVCDRLGYTYTCPLNDVSHSDHDEQPHLEPGVHAAAPPGAASALGLRYADRHLTVPRGALTGAAWRQIARYAQGMSRAIERDAL